MQFHTPHTNVFFVPLGHILFCATSCIWYFWKIHLDRMWLTQFWNMHAKKENVRIGKHTTRKEGTVSPSATLASSDFLFPLPTSSLMQLFIFPPLCPVRAERPGLLCSLVASGSLTSHMSFPTSDLMSTVEGNLKGPRLLVSQYLSVYLAENIRSHFGHLCCWVGRFRELEDECEWNPRNIDQRNRDTQHLSGCCGWWDLCCYITAVHTIDCLINMSSPPPTCFASVFRALCVAFSCPL